MWEDEGRMTCEEKVGRRVGRGVEGPWEGRTQREKSREERGDWGRWNFGRGNSVGPAEIQWPH